MNIERKVDEVQNGDCFHDTEDDLFLCMKDGTHLTADVHTMNSGFTKIPPTIDGPMSLLNTCDKNNLMLDTTSLTDVQDSAHTISVVTTCTLTGSTNSNHSVGDIIDDQCDSNQDIHRAAPEVAVNMLPAMTSVTSVHMNLLHNISPSLSSHGVMLSTTDTNRLEGSLQLPVGASPNIYIPNIPPQRQTREYYSCRWIGCKERLPGLDELVNHVNDAHVKVYGRDSDYKCHWEGCPRKGKGFNARYKMLIHVRTHTNEKPHKCNNCGKSFSRLENLKIHTRSHTGEKPYVCPVQGCLKAYSNSSDRFKHVRTHQEEKPYPCKFPGCPKRYTDPSSLRKHIKTNSHIYRGDTGIQTYDALNGTQTNSSVPKPIPLIPLFPSSNNLGQFSVNGLVPAHIIPIPSAILQSNNMVHLSSLTSNPLLSAASLLPSAMMNTQSASTQTDNVDTSEIELGTPTKDLKPVDESIVANDPKCQETPLDLSTNPLLEHGDASHFENVQCDESTVQYLLTKKDSE